MSFLRRNFILLMSFIAIVIAMIGITIYAINRPSEESPDDGTEDTLNEYLSDYELVEPQNDITSFQLILQSEYDQVVRNGSVLLAARYIPEGIQVVDNSNDIEGGVIAVDDSQETSEPPSLFDQTVSTKNWEVRVVADLDEPCLIGEIIEGDINANGEKIIRFTTSEDGGSECSSLSGRFDGAVAVAGEESLKFQLITD